MSIFDREVHGGLDEMFDLNHDGRLDPSEQGMEYQYLNDLEKGREPFSDPDDDDILGNLERMDDIDED